MGYACNHGLARRVQIGKVLAVDIDIVVIAGLLCLVERKREGILAQMGQLRDIVATFAPSAVTKDDDDADDEDSNDEPEAGTDVDVPAPPVDVDHGGPGAVGATR